MQENKQEKSPIKQNILLTWKRKELHSMNFISKLV